MAGGYDTFEAGRCQTDNFLNLFWAVIFIEDVPGVMDFETALH